MMVNSNAWFWYCWQDILCHTFNPGDTLAHPAMESLRRGLLVMINQRRGERVAIFFAKASNKLSVAAYNADAVDLFSLDT